MLLDSVGDAELKLSPRSLLRKKREGTPPRKKALLN
jgi:hypothetical protein